MVISRVGRVVGPGADRELCWSLAIVNDRSDGRRALVIRASCDRCGLAVHPRLDARSGRERSKLVGMIWCGVDWAEHHHDRFASYDGTVPIEVSSGERKVFR